MATACDAAASAHLAGGTTAASTKSHATGPHGPCAQSVGMTRNWARPASSGATVKPAGMRGCRSDTCAGKVVWNCLQPEKASVPLPGARRGADGIGAPPWDADGTGGDGDAGCGGEEQPARTAARARRATVGRTVQPSHAGHINLRAPDLPS